MAEQEAGLRIGDKFYPFANSYTLGEARVLKQLTGMTLNEFARRIEETDEDGTPKIASDPDHLVFLIWVAMHRENPKVTIADVESLDIESTFAGFEGPVSEQQVAGDAVPPAGDSSEGASGKVSEDESAALEGDGRSVDSVNESEKSTESSLEPTPLISGLPG